MKTPILHVVASKPLEDLDEAEVPMKRLGVTVEVADRVLFLVGGRVSFITGVDLCVDGGYTER
jgi:NAD(P)-dependent dehydrogenase (short-subunit alcohol dehydrogenase family)